MPKSSVKRLAKRVVRPAKHPTKRPAKHVACPRPRPPETYFTHPPDECVVPAAGVFEDARGRITRLTDKSVGSVQLIFSKAGTCRATHWHKKDAHLCHVVSGAIDYYERPVGVVDPPTHHQFAAGDSFYTGPQVEHEMHFPTSTVFVVMANRHRTPKEYEADLVRLTTPLVPVPGAALTSGVAPASAPRPTLATSSPTPQPVRHVEVSDDFTCGAGP